MTIAHAPAKIILCGEHAVVYGRPAIAIPVLGVQAQTVVEPGPRGTGIRLVAPAFAVDHILGRGEPPEHGRPLVATVQNTLRHLGMSDAPDLILTVTSDIPPASGMGSGAAVAVSMIRALSLYLGRPLAPADVSALAYQTEVLYHGTPSGIDNTVVAYEQPVYFVRGVPPEPFWPGSALTFVIGHTGVASHTKDVVAWVRARYTDDPGRYGRLFDAIGELVHQARVAIVQGQAETLGDLMNRNHALLQELGVSSPTLDALVQAARMSGAWGAKMSGAGWGGSIVALAGPGQGEMLATALQRAGAAWVGITTIGGSHR